MFRLMHHQFVGCYLICKLYMRIFCYCLHCIFCYLSLFWSRFDFYRCFKYCNVTNSCILFLKFNATSIQLYNLCYNSVSICDANPDCFFFCTILSFPSLARHCETFLLHLFGLKWVVSTYNLHIFWNNSYFLVFSFESAMILYFLHFC